MDLAVNDEYAAARAAFDPAAPDLPARLARWLGAQWGLPVQVSGWRRYPAGMSWVTIGFTAATQMGEEALILRLGDPGGLFAPYRTGPEFLALRTLAQAQVLPIPQALLACDDTGVLGAPFMVVRRVEGDTPTPWNGVAQRDAREQAQLGDAFSDALGALHAFDWRASPLVSWADGLTRENAALREVGRWATEAGHPDAPLPPAMHYGMRWLEAHAPVADHLVVVHGDYRVGNFLRAGGEITAVLDWELVHLGDPHEDLAWAGLRAFAPSGSDLVGGLLARARFHARYSARSGIAVDPARLAYYAVLSQFKSAAMLLGAARRVQAGRASDVRMAAMGFQLAPTVMQMLRLIEEAP
ncbi:MAG: phosphotransferase family protein [Proteobacteria bacterium]|nr:phosphotransferase family protein [Pseudomonadota bacterium]